MSGIYGHIVHTKSPFTFWDLYYIFFLFGIQVSIFFICAVFDLKKQGDVVKMCSDAKEVAINSIHQLSDHLKKSGECATSNEHENVEDETSASSSTSSVDKLNATSDDVSALQCQVTSLKKDNEALKIKIKTLEEAANAARTQKTDDNLCDASSKASPAGNDAWFFSIGTGAATDNSDEKKKIEDLERKLQLSEEEVKKLHAELCEYSQGSDIKKRNSNVATDRTVEGKGDVNSEIMKTNEELMLKNEILTAQVNQLQGRLHEIEGKITGNKAQDGAAVPDKVYKLIEVYKDEIHDMQNTYAQQSYELSNVKNELSYLKKRLETNNDSEPQKSTEGVSKEDKSANSKSNADAPTTTDAGWFGWSTPVVTPVATPDRLPKSKEEKDPTITKLKKKTPKTSTTTTTTTTNVIDASTVKNEEKNEMLTPRSPTYKPAATPGKFREIALASEPVKAVMKTEPNAVAMEKIVKTSKEISVTETTELKKASMLLQRVIRGKRGRNDYRKKLELIPHALVVGVEKANNLLLNDDVFTSLPDTYIIANIIRKKGNTNKKDVYSSKATCVAYQSTSPNYKEDLKLVSSGPGTLVLSVMSAHTMIADTFLGQVSINLEDYESLGNGKRHSFTLPLNEIKYPVYDKAGTVKDIQNRADITGEISFTIDTPPIAENIAGWWFEITNDMFGAVNSQKMWTLLRGDEIICYDSIFENRITSILSLKDIAKVTETEYTKTEIAMKGVTIDFKDSTVSSRTWCYGDDNLNNRGMWINTLKRHCNRV